MASAQLTAPPASVDSELPSPPARPAVHAPLTPQQQQLRHAQDLFIRRAKEYLAAAHAIDAAAKAGDVNKVMALHDGVDKACKACHDPFRAPKN